MRVALGAPRRVAGLTVLVVVAMLAPRAGALGVPRLSVTGASLIEQSTGEQLFGVNAERELAIASTTKLMTALVILEHVHNREQLFTQNDYVSPPGDSQIGLVPGERMSVHDLMLAMLLPSADDAAEDLAYNVGGGSVSRFVTMMNAQARLLGLDHTHYSTPIGLDTPRNHSSPHDLVRLASFVLGRYPFFARAVALVGARLSTGRYARTIINLNDLVGRVPWIHGVKTGHTLDAGYVLVAAGRRDGMSLISSVLGTSSAAARDQNTLSLLEYGFASFRLAHPVRRGQVLARPAVEYRSSARAELIAAFPVTQVVARRARVTLRVQAPRQLAGPLRRHAIEGHVVVWADGRPIARVPLLLAEALPAVSPLTIGARFLLRPSTLLVLCALLAAPTGWGLARRARGRDPIGPRNA
ncbi:MAG: D-alanyl-D-alanine carboxypeptidase family protein [Solirubrobacteraceae bacterium]